MYQNVLRTHFGSSSLFASTTLPASIGAWRTGWGLEPGPVPPAIGFDCRPSPGGHARLLEPRHSPPRHFWPAGPQNTTHIKRKSVRALPHRSAHQKRTIKNNICIYIYILKYMDTYIGHARLLEPRHRPHNSLYSICPDSCGSRGAA